MRVSLIVAQSLNGIIGNDGAIPWSVPEDMRFFREVTMGSTLIMGRRTWDSIARALPGRQIAVVSTTERPNKDIAGVGFFTSPSSALDAATTDSVFVAGGPRLYRELLPQTSEVFVTLVKRLVEGDTAFDIFGLLAPAVWRLRETKILSPEAELFHFQRLNGANP